MQSAQAETGAIMKPAPSTGKYATAAKGGIKGGKTRRSYEVRMPDLCSLA